MAVLERVAVALENAEMLRSVLARRAALAADEATQIDWLEKLGALELSSHLTDEAVATWKRAGLLAEGIDDASRARALYDRVREVAPDDGEAAYRLASLLERTRRSGPLSPSSTPSCSRTRRSHRSESACSCGTRASSPSSSTTWGRAGLGGAGLRDRVEFGGIPRGALDVHDARAARQGHTHLRAGHGRRYRAKRGVGRRRRCCDAPSSGWRRRVCSPPTARGGTRPSSRTAPSSRTRRSPRPSRRGALYALESLLSSEPADARRADRRWLFSWRTERAADSEKVAALEAWAEAEESTLADPGAGSRALSTCT
jgi:hypothetical protein